MIKNEFSATNEQLGAVRRDLKHNREFGALFHFFLNEMVGEGCRFFEVEYGEPPVAIQVDYQTVHDLCVKLLNVISE